MRIASLTPRLVTEADVQQLVRENEFRFVEAERSGGIDEQLFLIGGNRGDGDAESLTDRRIFDNGECCGQRAEKRIAVDEPAPGTFGDRKILIRCAEPQIVTAGD